MSISAQSATYRFLLAVGAGLTGTAALAIGMTIWWLHSDAIADAVKDTSNLATVLAHQIDNSVQSVDLILSEIRDRQEAIGTRAHNDGSLSLRDEGTHRLLLERLSRLRQAEFIGLIDENGRLVNSTQKWPSSDIDVSDAPHVSYFKNNADKGIYIGNSQADRIKGNQVVLFSKRINGPNGEFLGVVVVGVRIGYFQQNYESIASLPDQSFLLLHRDGTLIARYPDAKVRMNENMPKASPWHQLVLKGGGQYRSPGYFDSKARLVIVHPLRDYPLVINIGITEDAALASWRIQATTLGTGALLTIFCVTFLLKAQSKQFSRLATSEATLKQANVTVDAALNNMSQGLVMFNSSGELVVCNRRYLEMYGLSPDVIRPGSTLREILDHGVANGGFHPDGIEQYADDLLAANAGRQEFTELTTLKDGRIIEIVSHLTADGGSVATHEDVTEQKRAEERISYAAHHDSLTDLPTRTLFNDRLDRELKHIRGSEQLAVLYLDLDHLKQINDTLGHAIGDKLLKGVADRLRDCVGDAGMVARLSGDEFAVIQVPLDGPSAAADLAVRVRNAIHETFDLDGHQVVVDISVGISIAPTDATELSEVLKSADIALYEAKNTGRGTHCFYAAEMNERMQARGKLEKDLRNALKNGEFEVFYQPVVNLNDNKIISFEALLRWHHPQRGLVSPAEFIPVAEETGLIVPLGEWVLRTACAEAANWPDNVGIAVNVSTVQLINKNLSNVVLSAIASAGIRPNRLEIEITESVMLQNTTANLSTLKALHTFGVRFAMDDFGTGYSSLGYLLSFPFSKIKIDRSFIIGLVDKQESRAVVRAIADLARNLNMCVIAEGVETEQQLEQVRLLGCSAMQGYLYSPPRPAAEARRLLPPGAEDGCSRESPRRTQQLPRTVTTSGLLRQIPRRSRG